MSNITTTETRPEVVEKMNRWAAMGRRIHDQTIALQVQSQSIILAAPLPTDQKKIAEYDVQLKALRAAIAPIETSRKDTTSKFEVLKDNLMQPEKSAWAHVAQYETSLLALKKKQKEEDELEEAKANELRRIREAILNKIGDQEASYKQKIATTTHLAFESALKGGITEEMLPAWLADIKQRGVMNGDVSESFVWARPGIKPVHNTVDVVNAIWTELESKIMKPEWYRTLLDAELDKRFEFYGIAVKHKAETLAQSEKELAATVAEIADEKENAVVANKMESIATTYTVAAGGNGKQLKGVWEVEMPDTEEAALKIMSAFIGNIAACRGGVRASWSKLSVTQMATALAWAKNKDRNFTVTGINFVERDKL